MAVSDQSLQDARRDTLEQPSAEAAATPMVFRELTYPLGRWTPETGTMHAIAPGVYWIRMPLPFSLNHINLWVLDDGDAWVIVDTGLNMQVCREAWETLFAGPLSQKPVSRIIVTHYHPDHIGLAGWLTQRTGAPMLIARTEFLMARMLCADVRDQPPDDVVAFYRLAGWKQSWIDALLARGWGNFAKGVAPLPVGYQRIQEGDELTIGGHGWRIVTGTGHAPEHSCLLSQSLGLLISGDQVLPRITSNVSVYPTEPDGNPLKDWMDSLEMLKTLPADVLVLPSHNEPFVGLHIRCNQLLADHGSKLERLAAFLDSPRAVVDCFEAIFGRKLSGEDAAMATGEAIAHLHYLVRNGLAVRTVSDGVAHFARS